MRTQSTLIAVLLVGIIPAGTVRADDERSVIVCDGDTLPKVAVGDLVRITQSGASGRSEITASVKGPAKLVSTTNLRRFVNGQPMIGATIKEFEIKAEKKGKAVIKVSIKDAISKTTSTKQYDLEIE